MTSKGLKQNKKPRSVKAVLLSRHGNIFLSFLPGEEGLIMFHVRWFPSTSVVAV